MGLGVDVAQLVKRVAVAYDRLRPPPPGLVVLAYHRVGGGSGLSIDLDPSLFAEQMAALASAGVAVSLDEGVARLESTGSKPAVAVTFDDGTADFIDGALPALVESGVPATYYIATDFIEQQQPFPDDGRPLSWGALAEAVSTGLITVGSHTHSHAVMDKLSPEAADTELRRAVELIGERLDVTADHFAYPKGVYGGDDVSAVVARHHRSAALARIGVNRYGSTDPLRLARSPIQTSDGMRYFEQKVAGGMQLEGHIRETLNRRRYAAISN